MKLVSVNVMHSAVLVKTVCDGKISTVTKVQHWSTQDGARCVTVAPVSHYPREYN
jgi:hypothetical protein